MSVVLNTTRIRCPAAKSVVHRGQRHLRRAVEVQRRDERGGPADGRPSGRDVVDLGEQRRRTPRRTPCTRTRTWAAPVSCTGCVSGLGVEASRPGRAGPGRARPARRDPRRAGRTAQAPSRPSPGIEEIEAGEPPARVVDGLLVAAERERAAAGAGQAGVGGRGRGVDGDPLGGGVDAAGAGDGEGAAGAGRAALEVLVEPAGDQAAYAGGLRVAAVVAALEPDRPSPARR